MLGQRLWLSGRVDYAIGQMAKGLHCVMWVEAWVLWTDWILFPPTAVAADCQSVECAVHCRLPSPPRDADRGKGKEREEGKKRKRKEKKGEGKREKGKEEEERRQ